MNNIHAGPFVLEPTVLKSFTPQNLHVRPETFHNITLPQYMCWANAEYEIFLPGFWITTRQRSKWKEALHRLRICKVMEFNTTRYFLAWKIRKKCFREVSHFFVNLTYVSTPDKICFSKALGVHLEFILSISKIHALVKEENFSSSGVTRTRPNCNLVVNSSVPSVCSFFDLRYVFPKDHDNVLTLVKFEGSCFSYVPPSPFVTVSLLACLFSRDSLRSLGSIATC
jgi:hypothetical protein